MLNVGSVQVVLYLETVDNSLHSFFVQYSQHVVNRNNLVALRK